MTTTTRDTDARARRLSDQEMASMGAVYLMFRHLGSLHGVRRFMATIENEASREAVSDCYAMYCTLRHAYERQLLSLPVLTHLPSVDPRSHASFARCN